MLRGKPNTFHLACEIHSSYWPLPTVALCQLGPSLLQAQRILPQTRWEPLGKRAIVSWEGLRLGGCWRNLRLWDPKSAHPTWQNHPGRRTFCVWEHHLNVVRESLWMYPAEKTASPRGWPALRCAYWIPIQTPPKASLLFSCRESEDLHVWQNLEQLWNTVFFCSFLSQGFPSPHLLLGSNPVSMTSFPDSRKAALAPHAPCSFGSGTLGRQEGFLWAKPSLGNREPWKWPRTPDISVGLFLSGMMDAHTHTHAYTQRKWLVCQNSL